MLPVPSFFKLYSTKEDLSVVHRFESNRHICILVLLLVFIGFRGVGDAFQLFPKERSLQSETFQRHSNSNSFVFVPVVYARSHIPSVEFQSLIIQHCAILHTPHTLDSPELDILERYQSKPSALQHSVMSDLSCRIPRPPTSFLLSFSSYLSNSL